MTQELLYKNKIGITIPEVILCKLVSKMVVMQTPLVLLVIISDLIETNGIEPFLLKSQILRRC